MKRAYKRRNVNWQDLEQKRAYRRAYTAKYRAAHRAKRVDWRKIVAKYLPGLRRAA